MENEIKFAETVMLVDAAYLNTVTDDLSGHFTMILNRPLPKADIATLLECLALDSGIKPGNRPIQVLFIYDGTNRQMDAFSPSDMEKELNNVSFDSRIGDFSLYTFEPSDMATREDLYLESLRLVADAKEVKRIIVVPDEKEYGTQIPSILNKVDGKEKVMVFGMNPIDEGKAFQWEMLGFSILQALGVKAEELHPEYDPIK